MAVRSVGWSNHYVMSRTRWFELIDTIVMLALDEVLDNLFVVQCIGFAKDMKGGDSPVETVDAQVLCEPVFEILLLL